MRGVIRHYFATLLAILIVAAPAFALAAFISFSINPADWHPIIRALFAAVAGTWALAVIRANWRT